MPYQWVEPEDFLEYKGVWVYEHYDDNQVDQVNEHWFDLWDDDNDTEDADVSFDIREYAPLIKEVEPIVENYGIILKALIDEGYLTSEGITKKKPGAEPVDTLTLEIPF